MDKLLRVARAVPQAYFYLRELAGLKNNSSRVSLSIGARRGLELNSYITDYKGNYLNLHRKMLPSVLLIDIPRLSLTRSGNVRYELKTPYRDGTTHVIFEPLDFIARLAALVPKPRVNLTRYHGVFAPNSPYRVTITPAKRGKGSKTTTSTPAEPDDRTFMERRASMTWAQRLKRVFNIDIETCRHCQGPVKIIACIEDPVVIEKILSHLRSKAETQAMLLPPARAPPAVGLFEEGIQF